MFENQTMSLTGWLPKLCHHMFCDDTEHKKPHGESYIALNPTQDIEKKKWPLLHHFVLKRWNKTRFFTVLLGPTWCKFLESLFWAGCANKLDDMDKKISHLCSVALHWTLSSLLLFIFFKTDFDLAFRHRHLRGGTSAPLRFHTSNTEELSHPCYITDDVSKLHQRCVLKKKNNPERQRC